mmetsp:Transcript_25923/g.57188  ORF Transcript_25923/g.57188 Transcript_25923/m.57188 type:complete len:373 (+) Transcript_25923:348-1466(+)
MMDVKQLPEIVDGLLRRAWRTNTLHCENKTQEGLVVHLIRICLALLEHPLNKHSREHPRAILLELIWAQQAVAILIQLQVLHVNPKCRLNREPIVLAGFGVTHEPIHTHPHVKLLQVGRHQKITNPNLLCAKRIKKKEKLPDSGEHVKGVKILLRSRQQLLELVLQVRGLHQVKDQIFHIIFTQIAKTLCVVVAQLNSSLLVVHFAHNIPEEGCNGNTSILITVELHEGLREKILPKLFWQLVSYTAETLIVNNLVTFPTLFAAFAPHAASQKRMHFMQIFFHSKLLRTASQKALPSLTTTPLLQGPFRCSSKKFRNLSERWTPLLLLLEFLLFYRSKVLLNVSIGLLRRLSLAGSRMVQQSLAKPKLHLTC